MLRFHSATDSMRRRYNSFVGTPRINILKFLWKVEKTKLCSSNHVNLSPQDQQNCAADQCMVEPQLGHSNVVSSTNLSPLVSLDSPFTALLLRDVSPRLCFFLSSCRANKASTSAPAWAGITAAPTSILPHTTSLPCGVIGTISPKPVRVEKSVGVSLYQRLTSTLCKKFAPIWRTYQQSIE